MPGPPVAERALHQFPQPGLLEKRTPATISFTSPKLTRKSSRPGSLPRPPYVAIVRGKRIPALIQAVSGLRWRSLG
jgi:hypothetical protein